jgi:CHAT domain-containing protein
MPGQSALPNMEVELNIIKEQATKFSVRLLRGLEASTESLIEGMEAHSWVHLACHGVQDTIEPLKSVFCLHNKRLELSTIIMKSFPYADFAFLSACQTAAGDEKLSEEAVHLAAGLMLAGYGSVIATTWSIKDKDTPVIMGHVYTELFSETELDSSGSVVAFHHAVKLLRQQVGDSEFLLWVPFIHVGV